MNHKRFLKSLFLLIAFISIILSSSGCNGKKEEHIEYSRANLKISSTDYISNEMYDIIYAALGIDGNIYVIATKNTIWRVNPAEKKEEILIEDGIGPDQVYKAINIVPYKEQLWVNSNLDTKKLYYFNIEEKKPTIHYYRLPSGILSVDAFCLLPGDRVAAVYTDWKDYLFKIIEKEDGQVKGAGKRKFVELMNKFNVNVADLQINNGSAYVSQTIDPTIQVFSLDPLKLVDKITLSPPFYIPMPEKFDVDMNNHQAIIDWMASWNRPQKLFVTGDWMLVRYMRGFMVSFYYELINLKDTTKRYYIDETQEYIYDFQVIDGKFLVRSFERIIHEEEDEVRWKQGEIIL